MAKSWVYSRQKHVWMQITLWIVLGAMVALAGAVSHWRGEESARLEVLGPPVQLGDLTFRVPENLTPVQSDRPMVLGMWVDERDPSQSLVVYAEELPAMMTAQVYLMRSGLIQTSAHNRGMAIPMAGFQGMMISSRGQAKLNGKMVDAVQVLAAVVLSSRVAITFQLSATGAQAGRAEQVMQDIAQSLSVGASLRTQWRIVPRPDERQSGQARPWADQPWRNDV